MIGDDDFPEVGLPEPVNPEVADFAGGFHLAVDRGREGYKKGISGKFLGTAPGAR